MWESLHQLTMAQCFNEIFNRHYVSLNQNSSQQVESKMNLQNIFNPLRFLESQKTFVWTCVLFYMSVMIIKTGNLTKRHKSQIS